jgi:glutamate dehydrogenase
MAFPPDRAAELARTYADSFDAQYRAAFSANEAIADIAVAEHLSEQGIAAQFGRLPGTPEGEVALRLHHLGDPVPLSRRVPLLEHLGFAVVDERTTASPGRAAPTFSSMT